eukprot:g16032.t1
MTRVYEEGSSIWARCPEHGYASAVVSSVLDEEYVEAKMVEGGAAAVKLQISSQVRTRPVPFKAADDCTSLTHLDDANILENLRERYLSGSIYTFTSSVLLAVNPYRDVSHLYTPEIKRKYVNIGSAHTLPPHPYALADMAYRYLHIQGNQALVISGESGAGKTETAKIVMSALADRSRTGEAQASDIQNRILNGANPILEAIGNATTKRNGNSSRFGKYNALCFNAVGNLVGAEVRTYLLESSRVVNFGKMERTYHVFYELLFGCDEEMRAELHLDPKKDYKLLCQGHCAVGDLPKFRQDAENFKLFDDGLAGIGFSTEERRNIYKCIAGIIHLGEVGFHTVTNAENQDTAACADADRENLARGAELCGFDAAKLEDVFVKKAMAIKRKEQGVEKTECYSVARTAEQAAAIQQSLLKMLYKRVFHLICDQINRSLYGGEGQKKSKHIGILDIYGFECLDQNSFEQVCINLANERLQKFFVQNVLSAEQVLYQKEGLPWEDVTLPDADPVLNCISTVFTTLDDHNARLAKNQPTTDQKYETYLFVFTEDCHRKLGLGGIFQEPKRGKNVAKENILRMSDGFVIQHYAGEVVYHTADFLEKNNAKLVGEAECLIRDSTNPTVEKCTDQAACQPGQNNFNSVARKYLRDLDSLMETLESCHLHYIRCFKPNVQQQAGLWNGSVMLEQMRQSGTIELVKIMHDGYPHRTPFQDLAERFQPIMPPAFRNLDARTFVETLMLAFDELKPRDWTIGMTRLFMKAGKLAILEGLSADGIGPEIVEKLKKHFAEGSRYPRVGSLRRDLHVKWRDLHVKWRDLHAKGRDLHVKRCGVICTPSGVMCTSSGGIRRCCPLSPSSALGLGVARLMETAGFARCLRLLLQQAVGPPIATRRLLLLTDCKGIVDMLRRIFAGATDTTSSESQLCSLLHEVCRRFSEVRVQHVFSHCGVLLNEAADTVATTMRLRAAAAAGSWRRPFSRGAVKQMVKGLLHAEELSILEHLLLHEAAASVSGDIFGVLALDRGKVKKFWRATQLLQDRRGVQTLASKVLTGTRFKRIIKGEGLLPQRCYCGAIDSLDHFFTKYCSDISSLRTPPALAAFFSMVLTIEQFEQRRHWDNTRSAGVVDET